MIDDNLVMMLRSKSALSRLSGVEVRAVIAVMEELGFKMTAPTVADPAGVTADDQVPATSAVPAIPVSPAQ